MIDIRSLNPKDTVVEASSQYNMDVCYSLCRISTSGTYFGMGVPKCLGDREDVSVYRHFALVRKSEKKRERSRR